MFGVVKIRFLPKISYSEACPWLSVGPTLVMVLTGSHLDPLAPRVIVVLDVGGVVTNTNDTSVLDSYVLGADNLIANTRHIALASVLPSYITTVSSHDIIAPTRQSDELPHAHLLDWPEDHKVKEVSDKSTMVLWPPPMKIAKWQPWLPPKQVEVAGEDAELQPTP